MNFSIINPSLLSNYVDSKKEYDELENTPALSSRYIDALDTDFISDPLFYKIGLILSDEGRYVGHVYFLNPRKYTYTFREEDYMFIDSMRKKVSYAISGEYEGFEEFVIQKCKKYVHTLNYKLGIETPSDEERELFQSMRFRKHGDDYLLEE